MILAGKVGGGGIIFLGECKVPMRDLKKDVRMVGLGLELHSCRHTLKTDAWRDVTIASAKNNCTWCCNAKKSNSDWLLLCS